MALNKRSLEGLCSQGHFLGQSISIRLTDDSIEKLRVLQNEGHEIGYHGLRHLNAVNFVKETSLDNYLVAEMIPGMNIMAEHGFVPTSFSYPSWSTYLGKSMSYFKMF